MYRPCRIRVGIWLGFLLWNGHDSYATIGKGSVSRDKDSSLTPNNSLGVLSGIAPLAERFVYLNFRYLVAVFYTVLRRLETLRGLNLGRCIAGYSDVLTLNIVSHDKICRRSWVLILWVITWKGQTLMYSVVVPRELLTVIARSAALMVFYTDGSLIGFAFHWTREGGFGYKIPSPAGIFTAELTALFVTLRHIGEIIQPLENILILTDSLKSVKALLSR
jgi:hypothetical protein